ncbi:hypothetical protein Nepgr_028004 [Nepenthes gracilis]|uniref:Uncharacterized protein n=1 Tax=Nepenthes gracilis TaxID=150966 RepID=A0AAD3Y454_NEPGR|nr:hypothetical protein Nepgr_028004 [Nepenthes gracilis]
MTTACNEEDVTGADAASDVDLPPNGNQSLGRIENAVKQGIGYTPYVECNADELGNNQLYQIYLCVDTSAFSLIECPVFPSGKGGSEIKFPNF